MLSDWPSFPPCSRDRLAVCAASVPALARPGRRAIPGPVRQDTCSPGADICEHGEDPACRSPLAICDCIQTQLSTQYDPITPLTGAELLAGLLGQNAVLVRKNGFGVRGHFPIDDTDN